MDKPVCPFFREDCNPDCYEEYISDTEQAVYCPYSGVSVPKKEVRYDLITFCHNNIADNLRYKIYIKEDSMTDNELKLYEEYKSRAEWIARKYFCIGWDRTDIQQEASLLLCEAITKGRTNYKGIKNYIIAGLLRSLSKGSSMSMSQYAFTRTDTVKLAEFQDDTTVVGTSKRAYCTKQEIASEILYALDRFQNEGVVDVDIIYEILGYYGYDKDEFMDNYPKGANIQCTE